MRFAGLQLVAAVLWGVSALAADVVATAGGKAFTAEEVDRAAGPRLAKLAAEEDRVRREVLKELIDARLLGAEAKRRGITVEELLAAEVTAKTPPVTDEELQRAVGEVIAKRPEANKPELATQMRAVLARRHAEEQRAILLASIEDRTGVDVLLEPPRVAIDNAGRPSLGPANAPVTIVVFSDFQCPYCKDAAEALRKVQQLDPERVRLVYRHFPLPIHPRAERIAVASECAAPLGNFWPVHDALFADTKRVADAELIAIAGDAGLDREAFTRCLDDGAAKRAVDADVAAGLAAGVDGTPSIFINGRYVTGSRTVDALRLVVAEELARIRPPATAKRKETR